MKHIFFITLLVAILLLAGCGPSEEEIATMTAAAWTATPLPTATATLTPTPTPIPFDLTVSITDQDGNPVPGASLVFPESGDDSPVTADDGGQATWNNLPGAEGMLNISAQGYLPAQQALNLERGPNEVALALERDPYGLLPSEACLPEETLTYVEDFQDSVADGWPEVQFNSPGWSLGPDPLDSANLVISAQYSDATGGGPINAQLQDYVLENGVWRLKFLVDGNLSGENWFSFNWLHARQPIDLEGTEVFDSRYQFPLSGSNFEMRRLQQPVINIGVARGRAPKAGEWHSMEIGTYQGNTEVWVDGALVMSYADPQPLPAGGIDFEVWLFSDAASLYFDDISLCELSAPFLPVPSPTPAP